MKQKHFLVFLVLFSVLSSVSNSAKAQNESYYYELIANPTKTVNFLIGFYYTRNEYITRDDGTGYTKVRMAIINRKGANTFKWDDYKIYILLKDGTLFYNYTTTAKDGELACRWSVEADANHIQYVCFEKAFDVDNIERVWLSMGDDKFFELAKNNK